MVGRARAGVLGLVGTAAAGVAVAGMAWACGPSGYGVPETPAAPPASTAQPTPQQNPVRTPAPSETSGTVRAPAAPSPVETGSATARSVRETAAVGGGGAGGGARSVLPPATNRDGNFRGGTSTPSGSSGQSDINARVQGATAGVVRSGDQSVFASSTAPRSAKAKSGKAAKRDSDARASESTAASEGWSGVTSTAKPSLSSAAAMGEESGDGLDGGLIAGIAILALGLVGITGGAVVAAARRRRAGAANR